MRVMSRSWGECEGAEGGTPLTLDLRFRQALQATLMCLRFPA